MFPPLFQLLCGLAVITVTLSSGLFLIFSDFIMRSLRLSQPRAGIEVMQVINREIFKSLTMALLLGNVALTVGLAGYAYFISPDNSVTTMLIAAAALYGFGTLGLTFLFNVPMNNRLDKWGPTSPEAATYWQIYVPRWSFWNYGRAIATAVSAICILIAIPSLTQ